jgi:hypothetical protein
MDPQEQEEECKDTDSFSKKLGDDTRQFEDILI